MPLGTFIWLFLSALVAGVVNSLAGGGTLLTFPALLAVISPVVANATNTVALVPGSLAGVLGYRREMKDVWRWALLLLAPSLIGGVVGSLLVTQLDPKYFDALIPWLILTAALIFLAQPLLVRRQRTAKEEMPPPSLGTTVGVVLFQFVVAVYGGYFGAGIGILMLSSLSLMGITDIHRINALKTFLAGAINGVSAIVFIIEGAVEWQYAVLMAIAAIVGGYAGARIARRMHPQWVRWLVIVVGFSLAGYYFFQQWSKTPGAP
jgi:uncharacterized protein